MVVLVTFLLRLKHHDKDLVGGFTGASDRFLRVRVHKDSIAAGGGHSGQNRKLKTPIVS